MPELPDISLYLHALDMHVVGHRLLRVRLGSPFLLRSVAPPLASVEGETIRAVRRLGKRIVFAFDHETFLVLHLMIAGRLKWKAAGRPSLRTQRRTLKGALTDPRLFSGIGNAYSDEILHAARVSPLQWTTNLSDEDAERLYRACARCS